MNNMEKERCPYELAIEKYFGLPPTVDEHFKINTDFGLLCGLLAMFDQEREKYCYGPSASEILKDKNYGK